LARHGPQRSAAAGRVLRTPATLEAAFGSHSTLNPSVAELAVHFTVTIPIARDRRR